MIEHEIKTIGNSLAHFALGFSRWLDGQIGEIKPDRIIFASREGWFLGKCWLKMLPEFSGDIHFVRTSRLAFAAINLADANQVLVNLDAPMADCTLHHFFKVRLNIDISDIDIDIIVSAGFDSPLETINRNRDRDKINRLAMLLFDKIKQNSIIKVDVLKEYYNSFGISHGRTLLVDIGYNANFQQALVNLFGDIDIHGRYIATFKGAVDKRNVRAWLVNFVDNRLHNHPITRNVPILEFLMMSNEGSLIGFKKTTTGVIPILAPSLPASSISIVSKIQEHAFNEFIKQKKTYKNSCFYTKGMYRFLDKPTIRELQLFSDVFIDDSFGGLEQRYLFIRKEIPQKPCLRDEVLFFKHSPWKGAALTILSLNGGVIWNFTRRFRFFIFSLIKNFSRHSNGILGKFKL